jgi:hypothetical protein
MRISIKDPAPNYRDGVTTCHIFGEHEDHSTLPLDPQDRCGNIYPDVFAAISYPDAFTPAPMNPQFWEIPPRSPVALDEASDFDQDQTIAVTR